jgi:hypothetical protein
VGLDALHRLHESQNKSNTCDCFTLMNRFSAISPVISLQVTNRIGDWNTFLRQGSWFRFPVWAGNVSLHHCVQNGSAAHPASYPMGTRVFSLGWSRRGVKLNNHLHLVQRSRMRGAIPPIPLYVFMKWCFVKHRETYLLSLHKGGYFFKMYIRFTGQEIAKLFCQNLITMFREAQHSTLSWVSLI